MEYIAIKNWRKYQADAQGKLREGPCAWIKDWVGKEDDYEYTKLTFFQRYVYDALRRVRGKLGHNPHNDPTYIARATHALPRDHAHIAHAIRTLHAQGLISLVESKDSLFDNSKEKSREEKNVDVDDANGVQGDDMTPDCPHGDRPRYCEICKAVAKANGPARPEFPAPQLTRKLGFDPLSYREEVEVNGTVLSPDEVHTIIYYHWKENPDTWYREHVVGEDYLLKKLPQMLERFPAGYKIPTRTIRTPDSACPLCNGTGMEDYTVEDLGRTYYETRECGCVKKETVEV
jgi:hypothetical protein